MSRHGRTMVTLDMFPAFHSISVMALIKDSLWSTSDGWSNMFLQKIKMILIFLFFCIFTYIGTGFPFIVLGFKLALVPLGLDLWPPKKRCLRMYACSIIWKAFWAPWVVLSPNANIFSGGWKEIPCFIQTGSGTRPGPPKQNVLSF